MSTNIEAKADKEELGTLRADIEAKADKESLALYLQTVNYAKEYMKLSQQNMQNLIDEARKRLPEKVLNKKELLTIVDEDKNKFDAFYVEFEDRFRGSREDIKKRVEVYLPYLENLPFKKEEMKIIDVGCGRGEWIELLAENGYDAQGIDLNRIMVAKSQELGLDVMEADVIEHLKSLADKSLHVITGFHIIEHLPFEVLMKMYEESFRVLKPGGMVIFETPNPENILVGACSFYMDPTHINPLVPDSMQFIIKYKGFENIEIKRLHKYSDFNNCITDNNFIIKHFCNEMDYALIGFKV